MTTKIILNICYLAAALCITYKVAWIARQVAGMPGRAQIWLRVAIVILGAIILGRATIRFFVPDPASGFDILRELGWCFFLAMAIAVLRGPAGKY